VTQLGIRDTPPDPADPAWRSDCLSRAQHTRLVDPLAEPAAVTPGEPGGEASGPTVDGRTAAKTGAASTKAAVDATTRTATGRTATATGRAATREGSAGAAAEALCAAITRDLLGDFAPALLLLPSTERSRARALIACARFLFDFARQPGPEGERLAGIARCEYGLEQAFSGQLAVPPILLRMGQENARRRWPPDALDELIACARRRALRPHAVNAAALEAEQRNLSRAVGTALLEERINSEVSGFVGALARLSALRRGGFEGLQEDQGVKKKAKEDEDEDEEQEQEEKEEKKAAVALQRECARLRPRLLRAPRGLVELPAHYRRAGIFCLLVALRLLSQVEEAGGSPLAAPPRLSPGTRIGMLLRARWFKWSSGGQL
jgi:phytoene/squalene synthetase